MEPENAHASEGMALLEMQRGSDTTEQPRIASSSKLHLATSTVEAAKLPSKQGGETLHKQEQYNSTTSTTDSRFPQELRSTRASSLPLFQQVRSGRNDFFHSPRRGKRRRRSLTDIEADLLEIKTPNARAKLSQEAIEPASILQETERLQSPSGELTVNHDVEMTDKATTTRDDPDLLQWAQMPPTPPRRNLRTRKPAQLAPYTTEMQRYRRRLVRNDWEDAVVVEREYLRAQREKRREREGGAASGEDEEEVAVREGRDQRRKEKGKQKRVEAATEDGSERADKVLANERSRGSRIADDIAMRFGGVISSSSEDEGVRDRTVHEKRNRSISATSDTSSTGARMRRRKRHRNALLSDSESSIAEVYEVYDSSAIESDAQSTDDATTVSLEGVTMRSAQQSELRDKDGYTTEERKLYEQNLKYLKRLMPIGQARLHAADVIAMQREKEAEARDPQEADCVGNGGRFSGEDLPESLRPGETRTRIAHRHDWEATKLIEDADEESDDSQIPSPESSLVDFASNRSESESEEFIEERRGATDYWPHRTYRRERDSIDRMLTSAITKSKKRTPKRSIYSRQMKLVLKKSSDRGAAEAVIVYPRKQQKRRKVDSRHRSQASYSIRQPTILPYGNPPIAQVKHRPRYSLIDDDILFQAFIEEFARARKEGDIYQDDASGVPRSTPKVVISQRSAGSHNDKENNAGTPPRAVIVSPRPMPLAERRSVLDNRISPLKPAGPRADKTTSMIQRKLNVEAAIKVQSTSPQMERQRAEMDIWRDVCDLRLTFGLQPLQIGTSFRGDTYIGRGRLYELLQLSKGIVREYNEWGIHVFGCELSLSSSTIQLQEALVTTEEQMQLILQQDDAEQEERKYVQALSDLLRLLAVKTTLTKDEEEQSVVNVIYNSLQHVINTAKMWKGDAKEPCSKILLLLRWYKVELSWRQIFAPQENYVFSEDQLDWQACFMEGCQELMLELLIYGLNRTMREIKGHDQNNMGNGTIESTSAEYWVSLIHLLTQEECSNTFGNFVSFWSILEAALKQYHAALETKVNTLVIAENGWYCLLSICVLGYFSSSAGNVISQSCLSSTNCWPLVTQMMSKVRLRADEQVEASMSSTSIETRDSYVRILLSRIWHLHSTWGWSFESSEGTLSKIYSLFDSHKLEDLPTEKNHDFAPFLRHYDESLLLESIQPHDKCFNIFIKILGRAAFDARERSKGDTVQGDRSIARLFSRFSPMRTMAFSKESPPTSLERSGLYNHYSIALVYLYYVPSSKQQRLLQIQQYLSFIKADEKSRLMCIRAIMYAMTVLQHHRLDIKECVSWFKGAFKLLVAKLEELHRTGAAVGQQLKWQREVKTNKDLLFVAMRSIQYVIKTVSLNRNESRKEYPNLLLIDSTWTSSIMQSQLIIEGVDLASEVCGILQTFFAFRSSAINETIKKKAVLPKAAVSSRSNEDSQDSCADLFDDVDFDDALLLDALESAEGPMDTQREKERLMHTLDREFAQQLHTLISPAIFQLLSNLFHPERQSRFSLSRIDLSQQSRLTDGVLSMLPSIVQDHDKTTLAESLIDTWSYCAWIMVEENNIRQWSYYFNYGLEDPKRLQGDVAKRDVTLRFLGFISSKHLRHSIHFSSSDVYGANINEFWTGFFASIAAPRLTSQHILCNNLKKLESRRDSINGGLLQSMDWHDGDDWSSLDFERYRLRLLSTLIKKFGFALSNDENRSIRSLPFASMTALLVSIRAYLTNLKVTERREYLSFCKQVVQTCRQESNQILLRGTSSELNKTDSAILSHDQCTTAICIL